MTAEEIFNLFTYHPPQGDQGRRYIKIREKARELVQTIVDCTPASADQTAAIRKVREAMMTANAAIACNETWDKGSKV
ncbi:MAG TPA: hypothetical protein VGO43_12630 [Pyrinomonadaceae bacterium]|jgi:hypothetical protein|nr:hypothetical protein [Pyrinomonadaceae bacterium]